MKSNEFRMLLTIQVITLIIVVILLFNNLANPNKEGGKPQGFAITSENIGHSLPAGPVEVNSKNNYVYGDTSARNFLIVFSRYNCTYCRYFYTHVFDSLQRDCIMNGTLKIVCKDLVGPEDKLGMLMSKVAEVARQTNHFPATHHLLVTGDEPTDSLAVMKIAIKAGITEADISQRLNSPQTLQKIYNDYTEAKGLNISATPAFVLNGNVNVGYMSYSSIISKIGENKNGEKSCDVK